MWSPTHVQVLVKKAKGLKAKGKNETNDAFVTIALGKEKYQTSVKERAGDPAEWCEQCELAIPEQGNRAEVVLAVLHRNALGVDEFLGQVNLPLQDYDVYEKPKTRWHPLLCKPGQNKTDYRGELELKLGFTVKATENSAGGSIADLRKGAKGSLTSLNKVAGSLGGSLLSLGGKERKNIKKLAKSVGKKVERAGEKARQKVESVKFGREKEMEGGRRLERLEETWGGMSGGMANRDPGVNSDEEDEDVCRDDIFQFDRLSARSSIRSELSLGRLGTVSPALTPDMGAMRRGDLETEAMPSVMEEPEPRRKVSPGKEDWQQKLYTLQRDANPVQTPDEEDEDRTSLASMTSHATLPDDSSLPSYSQAMSRKKKIIPVVQSEPESSPSPEEHPSSPVSSRTDTWEREEKKSMGNSLSAKFRHVQQQGDLGSKLKNSFSFKDKRDGSGGRKESSPAPSQPSSRTTSDSSLGPPNGTRVVLGRETSPTPSNNKSRIPTEIMAKFQGQSREDLIELVVSLQGNAECQGKKLKDLEDYLDTLLIRVMESNPMLLCKESLTSKPGRQ